MWRGHTCRCKQVSIFTIGNLDSRLRGNGLCGERYPCRFPHLGSSLVVTYREVLRIEREA